jgi:hypothetical protein
VLRAPTQIPPSGHKLDFVLFLQVLLSRANGMLPLLPEILAVYNAVDGVIAKVRVYLLDRTMQFRRRSRAGTKDMPYGFGKDCMWCPARGANPDNLLISLPELLVELLPKASPQGSFGSLSHVAKFESDPNECFQLRTVDWRTQSCVVHHVLAYLTNNGRVREVNPVLEITGKPTVSHVCGGDNRFFVVCNVYFCVQAWKETDFCGGKRVNNRGDGLHVGYAGEHVVAGKVCQNDKLEFIGPTPGRVFNRPARASPDKRGA